MCCGDAVLDDPVPDSECASSAELASPSADEPFIFLWDEKAGGSTFNRWLLESAAHAGVLSATHISDFWWPNIIGTPYFLKVFGEERRRKLAIVSGSFDWRAVESLCLPRSPPLGGGGASPATRRTSGSSGGLAAADAPESSGSTSRPTDAPLSPSTATSPPRRPVRCFVLLRDPTDRFVSYWLERSDRRLERGGERTLSEVPPEELEAYLHSIRADTIVMLGDETGVGCNREVGLCLDEDVPAGDIGRGAPPTETPSFRILRGPQNRLARMLDPDGGNRPRFSVAAARLQRCTVGLIDRAHRDDLRAVLAHRAPWIREVHMTADSEVHVADVTQALGDKPVRSYAVGDHVQGVPQVPKGIRDAQRNHWYGSESRWLRRNLSATSRRLLEEFNDVDVPLYHLGVQLFKRQAAEARLHLLRSSLSAWQTEPPRGDGVAEPEPALNVTFLSSGSWAHHFDGLGLDVTKFMTDGLKCLLTSRAMQCSRFLRMPWPDDRDAVVPLDDVRDMIRRAFPNGGAAYLVD